MRRVLSHHSYNSLKRLVTLGRHIKSQPPVVPPKRIRTNTTASTMSSDPKEIFRKDYTALPYAVSSIDMSFDIRDNQTEVRTTTRVVATKPDAAGSLFLNGEALELSSIAIDGAPLTKDEDYAIEAEGLRLLKAPARDFELQTTVKEHI